MIGNKGSFHSMYYPGDYSSDNECMYTMVADDPMGLVELNFETFDLQESINCEKDYIQIYDGDSTASPLLHADKQQNGRFCGSKKPPVTISSTKVLTVRFHSDENITSSGFSALWKKVAAKKGEIFFVSKIFFLYHKSVLVYWKFSLFFRLYICLD